jgi:Putative adhesin
VHTFPTPGKVSLRIAIGAGAVSVKTDDVPETTVEVEALRRDDVTLEAMEQMTIEAHDRGSGHDVRVEVPKGKGGWLGLLGRGPKIGVRVSCPHGTDLRVETSSADLDADGRFGDAEVSTASGDVSFESVEGALKVTSASGDVSVRDAAGPSTIKAASGDASVGRAGGPLSVNLVSGDLDVREVHEGLSTATVSGDQEIEAICGGDVKLQSVSGDVRVGVRPGLKLWIDASSVSGSMRSELETEDAPPAGEVLVVELRARTVSGDVQIVRAAPVF